MKTVKINFDEQNHEFLVEFFENNIWVKFKVLYTTEEIQKAITEFYFFCMTHDPIIAEFREEYIKAYKDILPKEVLEEGNTWFESFLTKAEARGFERGRQIELQWLLDHASGGGDWRTKIIGRQGESSLSDDV